MINLIDFYLNIREDNDNMEELWEIFREDVWVFWETKSFLKYLKFAIIEQIRYIFPGF